MREFEWFGNIEIKVHLALVMHIIHFKWISVMCYAVVVIENITGLAELIGISGSCIYKLRKFELNLLETIVFPYYPYLNLTVWTYHGQSWFLKSRNYWFPNRLFLGNLEKACKEIGLLFNYTVLIKSTM